MKRIEDAKEKIRQLSSDLSNIKEEKLIKGYKEAHEDYLQSRDYKHRIARDLIGSELKKRGVDLDKLVEE